MHFFVERFIFGLSFWYHFFIGAKSLSLQHFFEVCKQLVVAGGQIWRIECMWKQFEVQFVLFFYHCNWLVTLHCFGERAFFSSSFVAIFWRFLLSNVPIMLYNIRYKWFFLAYWRLHLWLLWTAFTWCCPLSWLPIWLQSEVVNPCFIHFHMFMQKLLFGCIKTVANNALNYQCIVVFGWLWLTNVHAKWWIHGLLISSNSLLSHTTSIYNQPKRVCEVFWCFLGQLLNLGNQSVQHHLCLGHHV